MWTRLFVSCAVLAGASFGTPARAQEARAPADKRSAYIFVVPPECEAYSPAPGDASELTFWYRRLSLAACMQPTTVTRITNESNIDEIVYNLAIQQTVPMLLYRDAIQRGPSWVKLRAAYHVGLATVAFVTRMRASVVEPSNRALRARLERRLVQHRLIARLAFAMVGSLALEDPTLASDPVGRGMIEDGRRMLELLGGRPRLPPAPDRDDYAQVLR